MYATFSNFAEAPINLPGVALNMGVIFHKDWKTWCLVTCVIDANS